MVFSDPAHSANPLEAAVLGVETSGARCGVALITGTQIFSHSVALSRGHSRQLFESLDRVLSESGLALSQLAAIGFGSGPGAFVGLRMACAFAQGLGFALGRPLVPVSTPQALAVQALVGCPAQADAVWVALDLRMGEVAVAAFDRISLTQAWPRPRWGPLLCHPDQALLQFNDDPARQPILAGDGWQAHPRLLEGRARPECLAASALQPDAVAVARLAQQGLRTGQALAPEDAAPSYLRDKVALDAVEQAAARRQRLAQGGA